MEHLKLKDLNLSLEESRDIIEFLARKRGVSNYKRKSNDELFLARKKGVSNYKRKSNDELLNALKEYKTENNQQQQIKSKNKGRIDVMREELKELSYKLSKSELKEIKKNLYQIENKKGSLESKNPKKYLDELDKKIRKLDKYYHDDDFEYRGIKNTRFV